MSAKCLDVDVNTLLSEVDSAKCLDANVNTLLSEVDCLDVNVNTLLSEVDCTACSTEVVSIVFIRSSLELPYVTPLENKQRKTFTPKALMQSTLSVIPKPRPLQKQRRGCHPMICVVKHTDVVISDVEMLTSVILDVVEILTHTHTSLLVCLSLCLCVCVSD